jgi:DNA-binding CsgD family transcriptional regulator
MLKISGKTVETHKSNLMMKLNVKNIAELTKIAIREGLTSL